VLATVLFGLDGDAYTAPSLRKMVHGDGCVGIFVMRAIQLEALIDVEIESGVER
jgi:hypothetical protein